MLIFRFKKVSEVSKQTVSSKIELTYLLCGLCVLRGEWLLNTLN
jgi:hypothetical protein